MKKQWSTVLIIALMLLVVGFSVLNVDPVAINFGFTSLAIPLVLVIIGTLLIGVLIAVIWSTSLVIREKNQQKKLQKKLDHADAKALEEQEKLKTTHQSDLEVLKAEMEQVSTENRELKRRIQNMQTSQSLKNHE